MFIAAYSSKVSSQCHYRNFPLRVLVNAIEWVFAIAIMRNSRNDHSKYPLDSIAFTYTLNGKFPYKKVTKFFPLSV